MTDSLKLYRVVMHRTMEDLEVTVCQLMELGYIPCGAITFDNVFYYQAMFIPPEPPMYVYEPMDFPETLNS